MLASGGLLVKGERPVREWLVDRGHDRKGIKIEVKRKRKDEKGKLGEGGRRGGCLVFNTLASIETFVLLSPEARTKAGTRKRPSMP